MVIGLESLEEATEDEGESSWVKLSMPCLSDWANERRLWSLGVSISTAVLPPPLLSSSLLPLVEAVDVGVASGSACGRATLTAVVVAEGDEGKAGDDDDAILESRGKLRSALLLSLLFSRGLILLWSVLSCTMDEAILLRLLKPSVAAVPPSSSSLLELPSENCPDVGNMGEVGDIIIIAAIETPCGLGEVSDKGGNAAAFVVTSLSLVLVLVLLPVISLEGGAVGGGAGGGEK